MVVKWNYCMPLLMLGAINSSLGSITLPVKTDEVMNALNTMHSSEFSLVKQVNLKQGKSKLKLQQYYQHIPIYNQYISATKKNGVITDVVGVKVAKLSTDLKSLAPSFSSQEVLSILKRAYRMEGSENESAKQTIYIDKHNKAHLAYLVNSLTVDENQQRPFAIIDAHNGEVLKQWQGLTTYDPVTYATGIGGNEKTGSYLFGKNLSGFAISKDCRLTNNRVYTIDMLNQKQGGRVYQFTQCPEKNKNNNEKAVNGAFSPLNDAHAFASLTSKMFEEYYQQTPTGKRIPIRVHYGQKISQASWDGRQVTIGDGDDLFFPFSAPDVIAHEIAHGFTEAESGLVAQGQSGAVNESFSDLTGVMLKVYLNKPALFNQWFHGETVVKADEVALRYINDPTRDGHSIKHIDNYREDMDVHYAAGIFNYAFYLLAKEPNWSVKKAYDAFVLANQIFWRPEDGFSEAACGVFRSAKDLGEHADDVLDVFSRVGVDASCGSEPDGDDTKIFSRYNYQHIENSEGSFKYYFVDVPAFKTLLRIRTFEGQGDVDMYVSRNRHPTLGEYNCKSANDGNNEICDFELPKAGRYYILLHGYQAYSELRLRVDAY